MLNRFNKIDLVIAINIVLILISLLLIDKTNIDLSIQNLLFDFENKKWLIDKQEPIAKFLLYQLPKILLGIIITFSLLILIINKFHNRIEIFKKYNHQILILFLGITLIPLIVGNIKKFTNIYCPYQLKIYDGSYPYTRIFEHYPNNFYPTKKGQCFPAGHAITGFCLMILFFVFQNKIWKIMGLTLGVALGWIIGIYQIAKGAHFFGDTLVAMLCSFLIVLLITKFGGGARPQLGPKR